MAFCMIGGAHQRSALHVLDALRLANLFVPCELVGMHEFLDREVHTRWLQVLPDGHDVQADLHEIVHQRQHLVIRLSETHHDAAFCSQALLLRYAQDIQGALVNGLGTNPLVEAGHGFHVVVHDLWAGINHDLKRIPETTEVWNQNLYGDPFDFLSEPLNGLGKDGGTPILAFVPVHARDDGMPDTHGLGGISHPIGFIPVQTFIGSSGLDGAEPARARAYVAQDHEGGRSRCPALTHVRASRTLAYCMQAIAFDGVDKLLVGLAVGELYPEPVGTLSADVHYRGCFHDRQLQHAIMGWRSCLELDVTGQEGLAFRFHRIEGRSGREKPVPLLNDPRNPYPEGEVSVESPILPRGLFRG